MFDFKRSKDFKGRIFVSKENFIKLSIVLVIYIKLKTVLRHFIRNLRYCKEIKGITYYK